MSKSETIDFRRRQAIADLRHQTRILSAATVRRMVSGIGIRSSQASGLQKRLEWYFSGKVPLSNLRRDGVLFGAVLMASVLPEEDFEPFVAATALLLLERLVAEGGADDGFWNWRRLAPHYRLAPPSQRAAIMCGFREAGRLGRISLVERPDAEDCLSASRKKVLDALAPLAGNSPIVAGVATTILNDADARRAGALWTGSHRALADLPEAERRAALAGFRHLYERPASMDPPPGTDPPAIPAND